MTPNEEMKQAIQPIVDKMLQDGVPEEQIEIYRNGFITGAMWRATNLDWHQRRYEIARDVTAAIISRSPMISQTEINNAVKLADMLVSTLRKSKVTYGVIK